MKFTQAIFITSIAVLCFEAAHASGLPTGQAGTIYQVEPASKGNTITLELTNKLGSPLTDLIVAVVRRPNWISIRSATLDVASLPADSSGHVLIAFDVVPDVQSGDLGDVTIVLFAGRAPILQKTLSLMVSAPTVFELDQNYPNPFNPSTTIPYQLPVDGLVTLKVFDLLGREIATLVNEQQKAGYYRVTFDANRLASGVYFYRLQARSTNGGKAGDFAATKRLMVLK